MSEKKRKKDIYSDDYAGDIDVYKRHRQRARVLIIVITFAGIIAAAGVTYLLMNPAETMTEEGIEEMDANDFIIADEDVLDSTSNVSDVSAVIDISDDTSPLIEEADENGQTNPPDAFDLNEEIIDKGISEISSDVESEADTEIEFEIETTQSAGSVAETILTAEGEDTGVRELGQQLDSAMIEAEETQGEDVEGLESEISGPEETVPEETASEGTVPEETASEETAPEETASEETVPEETASEGTASEETAPEETASEETASEETAPEETAPEETAPEETAPEETALEETYGTENNNLHISAAKSEEESEEEEYVTELVGQSQTEEVLTEEVQTEEVQTEESLGFDAESSYERYEYSVETEAEIAAGEATTVVERSADEVDVESEGEEVEEDWIDSVVLQVQDSSGEWSEAETDGSEPIVVSSGEVLKFCVTYTVEPEILSSDRRTMIYTVPDEITSVEESYGEIVTEDGTVIADFAVDQSGIIRVTFTEEIAKLNESGVRVICQIEFNTIASSLKNVSDG